MLSMTSEAVSSNNNTIISLWIDHVQYSVHGILENSPACHHLTSLYIRYLKESEDKTTLAHVLPQLQSLQHIVYSGNKQPTDDIVVQALQHLTTLRCIELERIALNHAVSFTHMPLLEAVVLSSLEGPHLILPSLCQCRHLKYLGLIYLCIAPPEDTAGH